MELLQCYNPHRTGRLCTIRVLQRCYVEKRKQARFAKGYGRARACLRWSYGGRGWVVWGCAAVPPSHRPTVPGPVDTGDSHSCNRPTAVPQRPSRPRTQGTVQDDSNQSPIAMKRRATMEGKKLCFATRVDK
jgi:hypothetical protein